MCIWPFKPKPPVPVFPEDKTGYTLIFYDEFDIPQVFPNDIYDTCEIYGKDHTLLGGEPPYIVWKPSQVKQEGSCCVLTNTLNNITGEPLIKAGEICTWPSTFITYGYVEVKCKVPPNGISNWFCNWLVGKTWDSEIDFAEFTEPDSTSYSVTIHQRINGVMGEVAHSVIKTGVDLSLDFHVYAVDWQPQYVRFYLDNKLVFEYTGANMPSMPMCFIADICVKPGYVPDGSLTFPNEAQIDYLKIYSKNKTI